MKMLKSVLKDIVRLGLIFPVYYYIHTWNTGILVRALSMTAWFEIVSALTKRLFSDKPILGLMELAYWCIGVAKEVIRTFAAVIVIALMLITAPFEWIFKYLEP